MANHLTIGQQGEAIAAAHLVEQGYKIHGRNVRLGHDEIDIVAYGPIEKMLVFTEVKTRSQASLDYHPELNVSAVKRQRMIRAAHQWIDNTGYDGSWRMDIILVVKDQVVQHLQL